MLSSRAVTASTIESSRKTKNLTPLIPSLDLTGKMNQHFSQSSLSQGNLTNASSSATLVPQSNQSTPNLIKNNSKLDLAFSSSSFPVSHYNSVNPLLRPGSAADYQNTVPEPNADIRNILDAIGGRQLAVNKDEFRKRAKDRVISEAFTRCLKEMEESAKLEDFRRYEERKQYEDWKATESKKRDKVLSQSQKLKDSLDNQLDDIKAKHEKEQNERTNTVSMFFLPENAGVATSPRNRDPSGNVLFFLFSLFDLFFSLSLSFFLSCFVQRNVVLFRKN
jgi:hypothetical protein